MREISMRYILAGSFLACLVILVLHSARVGLRNRYIESLRPPEEVATLLDFRERMDAGHSYHVFEWKDKIYLEARNRPAAWTTPSGWSCYVFDESGRLLDWTWDNWSDAEWKTKWGETSLGLRPIAFQQIEAAVNDQRKRGERQQLPSASVRPE